jgi:hypothetical protein
MEEKEGMVTSVNPAVEEMEGARRATGVSSTAALARPRGYRRCPRSGSSGEGNPPHFYGGV